MTRRQVDPIAGTIFEHSDEPPGIERIEFRLINIAAGGPVVMTERIDVFTLAGKTFDLQVMGAFEVNDGKIKAWRDYFDPSQFNSQIPQD